jgi:hypothetical protein
MNAGHFSLIITEFSQNWDQYQPHLGLVIDNMDIAVDEQHPLYAEIFSLCSGNSSSLPYFNLNEVIWCTVAPNADSLKQAVSDIRSWVIPSFAGTLKNDGYINPDPTRGGLSAAIFNISSGGYYRWRCPQRNLYRVLSKLNLFRRLEKDRPKRTIPVRPSLYELRSRFSSALLIGDRMGAEEIIEQLDSFQLETATNTQFMRIRMWHQFGELDRIRNHPDLTHILSQPLPPSVQSWIDEACGKTVDAILIPTPVSEIETRQQVVTNLSESHDSGESPKTVLKWIEWLEAVKEGRSTEAEFFIQEQLAKNYSNITSNNIRELCFCICDILSDEPLRQRERNLILSGISEIVEVYLREPEFPRADLSVFYFLLIQLWCKLHMGNSVGQQHGHVLLELASALLKLNEHVSEVCEILEEWWKAKPSPSQLYYALDAIELMERELPNTDHSGNLWIEAVSVIKRAVEVLPPSDRDLWRRVGIRLGFEREIIAQYLPEEALEVDVVDLLNSASLKNIAIVCLREKQATQAAEQIRSRCKANVNIITATESGQQTDMALNADVILFVWLASTHAVFRVFDGLSRKRLCYVQGTGSSSIVRALERWVVNQVHGS